MVKRALKIALAAAMVLLTAGCWDSLDIEDRDICTAIIVDYRNGEYSFYAEVAAISSKIQGMRSEQGAGQGASTLTVMASGKSLAEARLQLDKELNKPIFLGAVQALVLTEGMANNGIEEYVFRVRQMVDYRKTMDVIVTPDAPADFLEVIPVNESTVGFAIEDTLENLIQQGATFHLSLAELLQKMSSHNPCYLMATISIVNGQISLIGYTSFKGGYRQGFIPYDESRGIVYIIQGESQRGKPSFDYVVPLEDDLITMETELTSINTTAVYKDGSLGFSLNMDFKATPRYISSTKPLTPEAEGAVKTGLSQQLMQEISQTIALSQSDGCDYLLFSEPFRIRYPDIFEQMDWESEFKKAVFSISVNVEIGQNPSVDYNPYGKGENG